MTKIWLATLPHRTEYWYRKINNKMLLKQFSTDCNFFLIKNNNLVIQASKNLDNLDKTWVKMCLVILEAQFYILLAGKNPLKLRKISSETFCNGVQVMKNLDT